MQLRSILNSILDIRFHCHGLTEAEAMRLMTERAFQEEAEAVEKWQRVQLTSAQLCTYYVGYREVRDLVADCAPRGRPTATWRSTTRCSGTVRRRSAICARCCWRRSRMAFLDGPAPFAFAHRGFAPNGDENSLAAFQRAVDLGYTYLETDVRVTADGVALAFHDATLDRVTQLRGRIEELPWATVRTARIAGSEPIPLLSDVLTAGRTPASIST